MNYNLIPAYARRLARFYASVDVLRPPRKPRPVRHSNRFFRRNLREGGKDATILRNMSVAYYTAAGRRDFEFERLEVTANARVVACFKAFYYHPVLRRYVTSRYLYGVRRGVPVELKELPMALH
jgi:hypothetical protein